MDFQNPNQDEIIFYPDQTLFAAKANAITENILSADPVVGEVEIQVKSKALWITLPRPYAIHKLVFKSKGKKGGKGAEKASKSAMNSKEDVSSITDVGFGSSALKNIALYRIDFIVITPMCTAY